MLLEVFVPHFDNYNGKDVSEYHYGVQRDLDKMKNTYDV